MTTRIAVLLLALACSRTEADRPPPPPTREPPVVAASLAWAEPIAAEAEVYRASVAPFAIDPARPRRRSAHERTLATYRALRAYPGAPPRVPHGLTPEEARTQRCGTCHARGGYSRRFEAYAPVAPHPELEGCLQCHTTDASVTGIALPAATPDAACRQCHARAPGVRTALGTEWRPMAWPAVAQGSAMDTPQPIPHPLQSRGRCLACHAGPAAVAEIRTTHPERADCRGCHLAIADAGGDSTPEWRPEP
jgi:cytochrome c-type protein NapB